MYDPERLRKLRLETVNALYGHSRKGIPEEIKKICDDADDQIVEIELETFGVLIASLAKRDPEERK